MTTKFGYKAQLVRFQGIVLALVLCLSFFSGDFTKNPIFFSLGISIFFIFGLVLLWFYPFLRIDEDVIYIKRIFVSKKIAFDQLDVYLKKRKLFEKFTKKDSKAFGIDQRYVVVCVKNTSFFEKYILLTSQMNNFDTFLDNLREKIEINSVRNK